MNRNISEQEQGHAFIKAAKSGDYKTVRKLLIGKPSLVSACDLVRDFRHEYSYNFNNIAQAKRSSLGG